ncbi:MAG: DUF2478 domain-containing protein [Bacteroidota bacterium]
MPVLTAVRAPYDAAWAQFHGGLGRGLPTELDAIVAWANATVPKTALRRGTTESSDWRERD